jgi:hypothetical protein
MPVAWDTALAMAAGTPIALISPTPVRPTEITRSLPSGLFQHGGGLVGTPSRLVQIG